MMALVAVPELPQKLHSVQGVMFIKQVLSPSVHVKLRESNHCISWMGNLTPRIITVAMF